MIARDTDLAWLAGFIDGEGTVGISRTNSKTWKHPYLRAAVQVPNTDRRAIDEMVRIIEEITGKRPSVAVSHRGNERCRMAWRVKVCTQWELLLLLPAVMPYLRLKQRQAELSIEFCKRKFGKSKRDGYRWHEFRELDEAAYQECLRLNARGTKPREAQIVELKPVKEA